MRIKKFVFGVIILIISGFFMTVQAQKKNFDPYSSPLAHTFSIVAKDAQTGNIGVAVQSHWFAVGTSVTWAKAGVGAVATQSFVNPMYGQMGLELMQKGLSAKQTLDSLISTDDGRDFRQVALIDVSGRVAAYTGKKCVADAGDMQGDQFSVQANMMLRNTVWPAMAKAFRESEGKPLAERLVAALEAAQGQGGDIRGQQSAAVLVVRGMATGKKWEDRLVDLRVDNSLTAVHDIAKLLKAQRAYEHMNNGDLATEHGDTQRALEEYGAAEKMFPDNLEMKYWHAVQLANMGRVKESLPLFKEVFVRNVHWMELTKRLIPNKLLDVNQDQLKMILNSVNN